MKRDFFTGNRVPAFYESDCDFRDTLLDQYVNGMLSAPSDPDDSYGWGAWINGADRNAH